MPLLVASAKQGGVLSPGGARWKSATEHSSRHGATSRECKKTLLPLLRASGEEVSSGSRVSGCPHVVEAPRSIDMTWITRVSGGVRLTAAEPASGASGASRTGGCPRCIVAVAWRFSGAGRGVLLAFSTWEEAGVGT